MSFEAWKLRKQVKDSLAATDEARMREGIRIALRERRIRDLLGKKKPRDLRRNEYADEAIFLEIQRHLRSGATLRFAARKAPGVLVVGDIRKPLKRSEIILSEEEEADEITIYVPHWKHTGDKLKTFAWIMIMQEEGARARTLNLNIGQDVIAMAQRARERRGVGLARFLRERMTKQMKKALQPLGLEAPEFFIWVEADRAENAHLHGAIVIPDHPQPRKVVQAIRRALKAAGGAWNPTEHENQVRLKRMHDPAGWAGYITKWKNLSRLRIQNDNTVAASGGVRSRAAAWYSAARLSGRPIAIAGGRPSAAGSAA